MSFSDENKVILSGRLTQDGKVGKSQSDATFLIFSVASNRYYTKSNNEDVKETSFVDVTVWGPYAETLADKAVKGAKVIVVGILQNGQEPGKLRVKADTVFFS